MERYGREFMILTVVETGGLDFRPRGIPSFLLFVQKIRELGMLPEVAIAVIEQC